MSCCTDVDETDQRSGSSDSDSDWSGKENVCIAAADNDGSAHTRTMLRSDRPLGGAAPPVARRAPLSDAVYVSSAPKAIDPGVTGATSKK